MIGFGMIGFGITPASIRAITGLLTDIRTRLGPALKVAADGEVLAVAEELRKAVTEEFRRGTDSLGQSHDKTGATVSTFHVEPQPLGAFVVLGGAASLIEFGTKPHLIQARSAAALHWRDASGADRFAKVVHHPGTKRDPYVERAIAKTDMDGFAARVVGAAYAAIFLRSVRA